MSDTPAAPTGASRHTIDFVRDHAKRTLKAVRAGDVGVIEQLRALLPDLKRASDEHVRVSLKLADVQHAHARQLGYTNWAALKDALAARAPIHARAAQFLSAYRENQASRAANLLATSPEIARYSLSTACAVGDLDGVRAWLAMDRTLAAAPIAPDDTPPLLYAVFTALKRERGVSEEEHVALVTALLDAGADPNASKALADSGSRIAALYFPCVTNSYAVAKALLERGADPNDGESVYHAAQHNHREMLELLLAHGADLSRQHSDNGNTPLYFLATHRAANPITPKVILGMEWLMQHGADPNVPSNRMPSGRPTPAADETPLQRAAASGLGAAVIQMLIDHGAHVNAVRADGTSAYALAVRAGNTDAAEALARAGADASALRPVDRLLGACATNDAVTARTLAHAHPTLVASLSSDEGAVLCDYVGEGRTQTVALMLELRWPLTSESEWGGTPLHWAAWHGRADMVTLLIAAGAPINARDSAYGSSPIAWAAHGSSNCEPREGADYVAIVRALLAAGATRAESFNQWGESPESMAAPEVAQVFRDCEWGTAAQRAAG